MILYLALLLSFSIPHLYDTYLLPLFEQTQFNEDREHSELTYYFRECNLDDVTATSLSDITIDPDLPNSSQLATESILTHGTVLLPNLLSVNTSSSLRSAILARNFVNTKSHNPVEGNINEPNHRWLSRIRPYDSSLPNHHQTAFQTALQELSNHNTFSTTLEKLLGPNPALVELNAITSEPGAVSQFYHPDTMSSRSHLLYGRSYTPLYSVFVYLQNTTKDMGATFVCPGTHMCGVFDEDEDDLDGGFCIQAEASVGAVLIYNSQLTHKGAAHTAYRLLNSGVLDEDKRVVFILTFTSRPRVGDDPRQLALGSTYSEPWDMWGQTLEDMRDVDTVRWSAVTSLGVYKYGTGMSSSFGNLFGKHRKKRDWGWNFWMVSIAWEYDEMELWYFNMEEMLPYLLKLFVVNIVGLVLYVLIPSLIRRSSSSPTNQSGIKSLAVFYATSTIIALSLMTHLSNSTWGQLVKTHTRFRHVSFDDASPLITTTVNTPLLPPLPELENPEEEEEEPPFITEIPNTQDILISDRNHAYYLFANSNYLDYHPGNLYFHRASLSRVAHDYANLLLSFGFGKLQRTFLESIIHSAKHENGLGSKFLKHTDYSDWMELSNRETMEYVHRNLIEHAYPPLKAMNREIDYMLSQCKYGDGGRTQTRVVSGRNTVMMKRYVPQLVLKLRHALYDTVMLHPSAATTNANNGRLAQLSNHPSSPKKHNMFHLERLEERIHKMPTTTTQRNQQQEIDTSSSSSSLSRIDQLQLKSHKYGIPQYLLPESQIGYDAHEALTQVLEMMVEYMEYQVLPSMQKKKCRNEHESCAYWASIGECDSNEAYMKQSCAPACASCQQQ